MHKSVLLKETIKYLNIVEDGIYIDATLGYGGHSGEILKKITRGYLFAFDQDVDAINYSKKYLDKIGSNFTIIKSNFKNIKEKLEELNINEVDGILFDLGVSSPQLDNASRGFSYHNNAPLDMRMDYDNPLNAYEVINNYDVKMLFKIIKDYGEETYAKKISLNIDKFRKIKPIKTTYELSEIIKDSYPYKKKILHHPARKTFQAIRIEVNHELDILEDSINNALSLLKSKGVLCVITFHSLEDRIVKNIFKRVTEVNHELKNLPIIPEEYQPKYRLVTKKVIVPQISEIEENNRSRSAKLRVIERL